MMAARKVKLELSPARARVVLSALAYLTAHDADELRQDHGVNPHTLAATLEQLHDALQDAGVAP